ncbi:MAG: adenylyltransferase/cytidyltransferase family protein [Victivallaceae bacterium]|nr:adenylyltransferase/cytidyltransferase family protein [Victivallaceae bacterium]
MVKYKIVDISLLKPHIEVNPDSQKRVLNEFIYSNIIQKAITIDKSTKIIINGHNRYAALCELGIRKIPVFEIDLDIDIDNSDILAENIKKAANSGILLPQKTQYYIKDQKLNEIEPDCFISLDNLKTKVFTVGVFDLFHIGHVNMLKRAKDLGNYLIVGVQYNVHKYKEASLYYSFEQRVDIIKSLRYVDLVVPYEDVGDRIESIDFDIFAKGPDQDHKGFQKAFEYCLKNSKKIIEIPRTENISASVLRKSLIQKF